MSDEIMNLLFSVSPCLGVYAVSFWFVNRPKFAARSRI